MTSFRPIVIRRALLASLAAAPLLGACQSGPRQPPMPPPQPLVALPPEARDPGAALHALDRLGYGPTPGEVERVRAEGVDRWITDQLTPARIPEPAALQADLEALPSTHETDAALYARFAELRRDKSDEGKAAEREFVGGVAKEARAAHLDRAILSDRQLQEVLVAFWYNHFNVFIGKGQDRVWAGKFEDEAIRPHVLGRFRDMLEATARHPAMLFYLDNWQNTAPGSPGAKGKQDGLNENYARELMELHTLGVDGGYTQHDVIELARVLTGWGLVTRGQGKGAGRQPGDYSFAFDPSRHDFGDKVLLGHTIKGRGPEEVEEALGLLAAQPATAHHLATQMAQYFVADEPPPALVDAMAQTYLRTGSDLTQMMRTLVESPLFWAPSARGAKLKVPAEYVISSVRAAGIAPDNVQPLAGALVQMGQPLYGYETPDGYKMTEAAWLNPDAVARRLSFATALATGKLPLVQGKGVKVDEASVRSAMGGQVSPRTEAALAETDPSLRAAILLGSPDFLHR